MAKTKTQPDNLVVTNDNLTQAAAKAALNPASSGVKEGVTHRIRREIEPEKPMEEYDLTITREGKRMILPEGGRLADYRKAIKEMEEEEESIFTFNHVIPCIPTDGMLALQRAMNNVFGWTHQSSRGMFGPRPPHMIMIQTSHRDKDVQSVLWGDFAPPTWEGGSIGISVDPDHPMALCFNGSCKKKLKPQVQEIFEEAKKLLKSDSVYRGKAVELDLKYLNPQLGIEFNPEHHAPKYMDLSKVIKLIVPREVEFQLNQVWDLICYPNDFRHNNISLKHGVLLSGRFGTGKSLTAHVTAQLCEKHGFTFFFLRTPEAFQVAHQLAQIYAPAVLFVEDIDALFAGDRTAQMNLLLEVLDGISAKKSEVVTIFTSNFPEKINEAFMRRGRIDNWIKFTPPDAEAAARFVLEYAGDVLADDAVDRIGELGRAFAGLVPSSITEGIDQAKKASIGVERRKVEQLIESESPEYVNGEILAPIDLQAIKVDAETLLTSAAVMQTQDAAAGGLTESPAEIELALLKHVCPGLFRNQGQEVMAQMGAEAMAVLSAMARKMRGERR